ncbi:hypothetical protein PAMA_004154 [Pampus argenteus]
MDLDSMKYAELQSLAKELGLKANVKADKLLKAIKQHYEKEKKEEVQGHEKDAAAVQEDENAAQDSAQESKDATCKKDVSSTSVFVNTRRGKGNGTKRKISDTITVTECDELPRSAEKSGTKVAAASPTCSARGAKKRRVSPVKDSEKIDNELPTETAATSSKQQPDEAPVPCDTGNAPKVAIRGKIPRYERLQKKKALLKPVTPNFKKLHEAHFNKMESIDSYVNRKTKQMETYKTKKVKNANASRASMFSPAPLDKRPADSKHSVTLLSASKTLLNKPAGKEDAPFRPSVLSTRRINVRFSEATQSNEHKKRLVKTPGRMSFCVSTSTPQKQTGDGVKSNYVKTSTFSAAKTPGPFVFTGNTSTITTPGTQKKPNFDLKASLSRPLTYKPHTGKLKPFEEAKENKSLISDSRQKSYKQHQVETRETRRTKHTEERKQKKENVLGARRGLVMM